MFNVISHWLLEWFEPLGLVWLCLLFLVIRLLGIKRFGLAGVAATAWLLLLLIGCTPMVDRLLRVAEKQYAGRMLTDIETADVVVCLGGTLETSLYEAQQVNLDGPANRFHMAALLLRLDKAPAIVFTGSQDGLGIGEPTLSRRLLLSFGAVDEKIHTIDHCHNTHEEAVRFAALAADKGWKKILLVTSALHMRRAAACFTKLGVEVVPVASHYQSTLSRVRHIPWFQAPSVENLAGFHALMYEEIGVIVYRWRGWI